MGNSEAEAFKQEGNKRFKEQNFRGALGSYHKVFCYVNGLQVPGERNEATQYAEMMGLEPSAASSEVFESGKRSASWAKLCQLSRSWLKR
ncbi:unnamed protein product [Effrenium voratum]|nr:unnamed protein product [Effrenium voratum]CAJ1446637.1 unnamed protein product [Effrenium voratum]